MCWLHHLVVQEGSMRPCSAFPGKSKSLHFLKIQYDEPIDVDSLIGKESSNVVRGYAPSSTRTRGTLASEELI